MIHRGNWICEIDKESLETKRRIIGNWDSPKLLNIKANGTFHMFKSEMTYFLTIDQNGKIIRKVQLDVFKDPFDIVFLNNHSIL